MVAQRFAPLAAQLVHELLHQSSSAAWRWQCPAPGRLAEEHCPICPDCHCPDAAAPLREIGASLKEARDLLALAVKNGWKWETLAASHLVAVLAGWGLSLRCRRPLPQDGGRGGRRRRGGGVLESAEDR